MTRTTLGAFISLCLLLAACASGDEQARSTPSASTSPTTPSTSTSSTPSTGPSQLPSATSVPVTADARIGEVPPAQWRRMVRAGMVRPECPVQRRSQLRRVDVNHHTFRGDVRRGHVVVNADVAGSVARILTRLFEADFPIRRMASVEQYGGSNIASLRADNTAAFNCRRPDEINAPFAESPHANGRAIDINPVENPWRDLRCDCWSPSARFADRSPGPGKILEGGVVWRAFDREGWIWQNIDVADYMHFDTGYPSGPFTPRSGGS